MAFLRPCSHKEPSLRHFGDKNSQEPPSLIPSSWPPHYILKRVHLQGQGQGQGQENQGPRPWADNQGSENTGSSNCCSPKKRTVMLAPAVPSPRGSIASFIIEVSGEMGSIWQLFMDREWSYLVRERQQGSSAWGHMRPSQENLASLSPVPCP